MTNNSTSTVVFKDGGMNYKEALTNVEADGIIFALKQYAQYYEREATPEDAELTHSITADLIKAVERVTQ